MKIQLNFETVQPGFVLILGPTKKCLRIKFMEVPPKYIYINMYIYIYIYISERGFFLFGKYFNIGEYGKICFEFFP